MSIGLLKIFFYMSRSRSSSCQSKKGPFGDCNAEPGTSKSTESLHLQEVAPSTGNSRGSSNNETNVITPKLSCCNPNVFTNSAQAATCFKNERGDVSPQYKVPSFLGLKEQSFQWEYIPPKKKICIRRDPTPKTVSSCHSCLEGKYCQSHLNKTTVNKTKVVNQATQHHTIGSGEFRHLYPKVLVKSFETNLCSSDSSISSESTDNEEATKPAKDTSPSAYKITFCNKVRSNFKFNNFYAPTLNETSSSLSKNSTNKSKATKRRRRLKKKNKVFTFDNFSKWEQVGKMKESNDDISQSNNGNTTLSENKLFEVNPEKPALFKNQVDFDVPLKFTPNLNFPAITNITTCFQDLNLSTHSSDRNTNSEDEKWTGGGNFNTYKDVVLSIGKTEDNRKCTPLPEYLFALDKIKEQVRRPQSTENSFYLISSSSQSCNALHGSEKNVAEAKDESSCEKWWLCLCPKFLFASRKTK